LQLYRGGERFTDLGGLDALKTYCLRAMAPGRPVTLSAQGLAEQRRAIKRAITGDPSQN
jgi:hypothetical protein